MADFTQLIRIMIDHHASDLHLIPNAPPVIRVNGEILQLELPVLDAETCKGLIYSALMQQQIATFEMTNELDAAISFKGTGRVRINVYREKGGVCAALRHIPEHFLSFEMLGLPTVIYKLMDLNQGLILVTGPTGSGKSTTIASMVDFMNTNRNGHIVTIEDPIEFIHAHKRCIVSQREIGFDTNSFKNALKHALRQDPNIIVIGEMRDLETMDAALTLAETGHLVLATLHTPDASQTINRIIDVFPPSQHNQVRSQMSLILQGVIAQLLIGKPTSIGRVMANEVLIATPAVRNTIREGKMENLPSIMQTNSKLGMQTMNMSLLSLYQKKFITRNDALSNSLEPEELKNLMKSQLDQIAANAAEGKGS